MQTSQQNPYNFSTFKAPLKASNSAVSSSIVNAKKPRPFASSSNKQPLQSRYAQGVYNPTAENEKKSKSGINSLTARKHSLENTADGELKDLVVYPSTKRVKTALPSQPAQNLAPRSNIKSTLSTTNVVAAAKLSLKEKQLLKEKRIKRTGLGMKAKSSNHVHPPIPIDSLDSLHQPQQFASSSLQMQRRQAVHEDLVQKPRESRRDSRYNSIVNDSNISGSCSILGTRQSLDESLMAVDSDLLPVHITAGGNPKIIHVARASQKWTSISKEEAANVKDEDVLTLISVKKRVSTSAALSSLSTSARVNESNARQPQHHHVAAPSKAVQARVDVSSTLHAKKKTPLISKALNVSAPLEPFITLKKEKRARVQRKSAITQDPILALEYADEIYVYWREIELTCLPDPSYMLRQTELDWGMRATLLSWLVQVHSQFKLLPETFYLTVNLIDRTLSLKLISLSKLQLVGVTALLIASKYEEILSPSVQDLVYMTDNGYSSEEILRAERHMLSITGYQIGYCNPLNFLKRLISQDTAIKQGDRQTTRTIKSLCHYFLETMAINREFLAFPPSMQAAASYFLAIKTIYNGSWTSQHCSALGYSEQDLLQCVYALLECIKNPQEIIFEKYANAAHNGVSTSMKTFLREKGI